jgi:hypothetical protein
MRNLQTEKRTQAEGLALPERSVAGWRADALASESDYYRE